MYYEYVGNPPLLITYICRSVYILAMLLKIARYVALHYKYSWDLWLTGMIYIRTYNYIIYKFNICHCVTGFLAIITKCKALYESRQFGLIWHWYQSMYSYVCTLIYHHDLILFCLASHK